MDGIKVKVFDIRNGMRVYDNIKIIRIISKDYNLLIMKDYWPVVGEINGKIVIEAEESLTYENIEGFFALSHNVFHLIIKETGDVKNE